MLEDEDEVASLSSQQCCPIHVLHKARGTLSSSPLLFAAPTCPSSDVISVALDPSSSSSSSHVTSAATALRQSTFCQIPDFHGLGQARYPPPPPSFVTGLAEAVVRPHAAAAAVDGRTTIAVTTTMHSALWGAVAGSVVRLGIVVHRARQLNSIGIDWLGSGGGSNGGPLG